MASLRNHHVIKSYRSRVALDDVYHVTKNDRVVRTTGPRGGHAKILFITEDGAFNFSGQGRRATATEFAHRLANMEVINEQ